jgi:hypothetical protein
MRLTIDVKGIDQATRELAERFSERRLNAALATALTRTALDIREEVKREMRLVFDRPTKFTLGGVYVNPASGSQPVPGALFGEGLKRRGSNSKFLQAEVELNDDFGYSEPYLRSQVTGGARRLKGLEVALNAAGILPAGWLAVPGNDARRDAYGNVPGGLVRQVLSQLRLARLEGDKTNMSFEARKQITAQRKAGGRFFVVKPGAKTKLPPGVYQREFFVRAASLIFLFVQGATYRKRLDFYGMSSRIARERLPVHINRAIAASAQRLEAAGR